MKNTPPIIFLLLFLFSCAVSKKNDQNIEKEQSSVVFLVFNIHKDTIGTKNVVDLTSKTVCNGQIKKQAVLRSENYLTIYVYSARQLVDSIAIDHPLYKHVEYVNDNNRFTMKDTVLNNADFFVRLQLERGSNQIHIHETLKDKTTKKLCEIKI